MIDLEKLNMTIISIETLMHIINDPYVKEVTPYTDRNGLKAYSVLSHSGERYRVFTHE